MSSGPASSGTGPSRRIAPNRNSSDPSKVAFSAISSADSPVTTNSCAAAGTASRHEQRQHQPHQPGPSE